MQNLDVSKEAISKGNFFYLSGDYTKAIKCFKQAYAKDSRNAEPLYKLGLIYYRLGQTAQALTQLKRCTNLVRNNSITQALYGKLLHETGDINASLRAYKLALKADKNSIDAITGMASIHEYNKNFISAYELIKPILNTNEVHSQVAITFSRLCIKVNKYKQFVSYTTYCLNSGKITDTEIQSFMYYALGEVHDKIGNYNDAFTAYKNANEARKLQYDPYNYGNLIEKTQSIYNYSFFLKAIKSTNLSKRPVFIVGMPRSGTSLVEQILSSHSDVFGAGELPKIGNMLNGITLHSKTTNDYADRMQSLTTAELDSLANKYLSYLKSLNTKASIITDKMPHNYARLGFISQLFPSCKIIHCVRDPIDTCLSIYFKSFNDSHDYATDFAALAHQYAKYNELMTHWKNVLPIKIHEVRYEELITDFEEQTKKLVAYCNLDWEVQCLKFHQTKRHVATASQNQVSKPLYTTSINRWKNYRINIQPLIKELKSFNLI